MLCSTTFVWQGTVRFIKTVHPFPPLSSGRPLFFFAELLYINVSVCFIKWSAICFSLRRCVSTGAASRFACLCALHDRSYHGLPNCAFARVVRTGGRSVGVIPEMCSIRWVIFICDVSCWFKFETEANETNKMKKWHCSSGGCSQGRFCEFNCIFKCALFTSLKDISAKCRCVF